MSRLTEERSKSDAKVADLKSKLEMEEAKAVEATVELANMSRALTEAQAKLNQVMTSSTQPPHSLLYNGMIVVV